uniref:Uncharacterized protein n=1 Tax=Eutreptiella gymnastica TaxID=73025 RepID=A0A6T1TJS6_9EUGL
MTPAVDCCLKLAAPMGFSSLTLVLSWNPSLHGVGRAIRKGGVMQWAVQWAVQWVIRWVIRMPLLMKLMRQFVMGMGKELVTQLAIDTSCATQVLWCDRPAYGLRPLGTESRFCCALT